MFLMYNDIIMYSELQINEIKWNDVSQCLSYSGMGAPVPSIEWGIQKRGGRWQRGERWRKIKNNMTRKYTELDFLKMLFRVYTINVYRYEICCKKYMKR